MLLVLGACGHQEPFKLLPVGKTGIHFVNTVEETDQLNILHYLYMYNGGGVAAGDFNNDGLIDIYFTANQQENKLYLNKGGFSFEDVTETAGVGGKSGENHWATGVTVEDINGDGWLDIYVCYVHGYRNLQGGNQLFINNGDGTFTEQAEHFGLDAHTYAQQASFFDYDQDGDLDMYLLNHAVHTPESYKPGTLRSVRDSLAGDRLYENRNGFFLDVSEKAGIYGGAMSYGLSSSIGDVNGDHYPDIYVANDFHENDYLYYNQGDGTFREGIKTSMGHTTKFSMGSDMADINNDGLLDIIALDMKPGDDRILKMSLAPDPYNIFQLKNNFGYHYQFPRNMLQVNRGNLTDSTACFSDLAEQYRIDATDWSWGALLADFDLDGRKDLFITNGIPRRPNDLDFINFTSNEHYKPDSLGYQSVISMMPEGQAANAAFKNTGGGFEEVSAAWGLGLVGCSNGAAYADLDNDGDLDLIVNNLNKPASVYRNTVSETTGRSFLTIKLKGPENNPLGVGARVIIETAEGKQVQECAPVRGWLSSVPHQLHFGLGGATTIDKLEVTWQNGKKQILRNVSANQAITLTYSEAGVEEQAPAATGHGRLFYPAGPLTGLDFRHQENTFNDFDYEALLPHMLSTQGPRMAVGDVNNDGLDDLYIGGAKNQAGQLFLQQSGQEVAFRKIENPAFYRDRASEDVEAAFIDVDQDGDLDLYVVSGDGETFDITNKDRLYINNGAGEFEKSNRHPELNFNGSCAVVADINQDGVPDLFVGGRSIPGAYGKYPGSRILLGDGEGALYDYTARAFGDKIKLGMVSDAAWLEDTKELVVVGEWLPITIISFRGGVIEEKQLPNTAGWWNTIYAADLDQDGDQDLLAGNLGANSCLAASPEQPVSLYVKDFDDNSSIDPILTHYRNGVEKIYFDKGLLARQLPAVKKLYPDYRQYAESSFNDVFPTDELMGSGRWQAQTFKSAYFENKGDGSFEWKPLPDDLQMAPVYGFAAEDFTGDGKPDILAVGNFYANQVSLGRYDASYGHFLEGGAGIDAFRPVEPRHSGFIVHGEARDIKVITRHNGQKLIVVSRNNAPIEAFIIKISEL